ncbi:hypothetical protein CDL15_Pgr014430 [Punica granatum]|nr:hypothetical protein CDL15_Pgr014430 [Punica granatum]
MLSPFTCGTFHSEDDQDELGFVGAGPTSPSSTPRRSFARRATICKTHNKHNKNPYSTRGLDKFEALLADLEEKKKEIYTQNDRSDISFVRFAYTSSNDCVPIVVKLKDKDSQSRSPPRGDEATKDKHGTHHPENSHQSTAVKAVSSEPKAPGTNKKAGDKMKGLSWRSLNLDQWRRPSYYMPAAIILILVFLLFFGRSVAILCTSIGWYMVPTLRGGSSGSQKATKSGKKKELARRSSENRIVITQRSPDRSPRQHGHQRSW